MKRKASLTRPGQVLMHVGHGKTGSSFLQSTLANSVDFLATHGIAYPLTPLTAERARAGMITSGNLRPGPGHINQLLRRGWDGPDERLLLSSEAYFLKMRSKGFLERIRTLLPEADLRILLFIRDPVDHAVSNYQQVVKRHRYSGDFDQFLREYNIPRRVGQFVGWARDEMGVEVQMRNYSRVSKSLKSVFEGWLGVPEDSLVPPSRQQINRSLSVSEMALQLAFNRHYAARSATFVSDVFCEELPDIRAERPPVSHDRLENFLGRMAAMIETLDFGGALPEDEGYQLPTLDEAMAMFEEPAETPVYCFSAAQIDAFARSISARLAAAAPEPAGDEDEDEEGEDV